MPILQRPFSLKHALIHERTINISTMLLIFSFLLTHFPPNLILSDTTTTGGDTGSFNYMAKYMRDYLLPRGQMVGWSPDWYAGIPLFQFYFPLPFIIISLLAYLIPLSIAFKIVTVLGTFLLPVTTFFSMRVMRFQFPIPILASVFSLAFLFNESYTVWGGNIPSTLAGEFSYSLSLALMVLFIGTAYKGAETRKFWIANSLLYSGIVLTHGYTSVFALALSAFTLISSTKREFLRRLWYLAKVYFLSFLIVAFWLVPFFLKRPFSTPLAYLWRIDPIDQPFPRFLWPFFALAIYALAISVKKRDERVWYLSFGVVLSVFLYSAAPTLGITDIRFLPFGLLSPVLVASYGAEKFFEDTRRIWFYIKRLSPVILLLSTTVWVNYNSNFTQSWIEWNYSGFESKRDWEVFSEINQYLASLPPGRVVHEYSNTHDLRFGTPRAFESIPFFSGKPVLEGLLIESALSAPSVFQIQSEISQTPTCPIPGQRCFGFSTIKAAQHLKLFNVDYLLATSSLLKTELKRESDFSLLREIDGIEIYRVNNSGSYVHVPNYKPILVEATNWKAVAAKWFSRLELIEIPLVFTNDAKGEDSSRFAAILVGENISDLPRLPLENACNISERVENQEIRISTSCVGLPHFIKVSYFPNWKVEGADKVYLATPSFMLIYPSQREVRLYYGATLVDSIGNVLSAAGLIFIVATAVYRKRSLRRT